MTLTQNSVRHNLSLGTTFRKVLRNEDWQGKKGYFWEIAPNQSASIDNEMERFLVQEGQTSEVLKTSPSCECSLQWCMLSNMTRTEMITMIVLINIVQ